MKNGAVVILGIGNVLFSDEGFGIRVIETLKDRYHFADNVHVIDGGVLGINLMGIVSGADNLIVIDAIKNNGNPGDIHRIEEDDIPERIRAKNSLHQIDFFESLTLCQILGKVPKVTIIGVEPKDIETLKSELTIVTLNKIVKVIEIVIKELDKINVLYKIKSSYPKVIKAGWKVN